MFDWILYGAYGSTGQLLAEEAVQRGHRPLLAGRSAQKLQPLAERLGLDWRAVSLEDERDLVQLLRQGRAVLHAAGPFTYTGRPMVTACLKAGVHYLDITGEVPYMEYIFSLDAQARQSKIMVLTGAGLDVVPSDCLAVHVARQVPDAATLEIALRSTGGTSAGTKRSSLEIIAAGGLERRNGNLVPLRLGTGARWIRFIDKERFTLPAPWGDLVTAYRSTRIPNIRCYLTFPSQYARILPVALPLATGLLSISLLRRVLSLLLRNSTPPNEAAQQRGRTSLWAKATAQDGNSHEAWMETLSGYKLTAKTGVRLVEKVLAGAQNGACSPAQAYGPDFVLEIEGTTRYEAIPASS